MARQIIQEQMRDGGNALPWGDRERYCRLMLERSIASYREHAASDSLTFFDRGIGDSLCYARLIGLALEDEIFDVSQRYRYAKRVFLAPPWREICTTDAERKQTYDEVMKTYHYMVETYGDCGYEVVEIPRVDPAQHANFILSMMSS